MVFTSHITPLSYVFVCKFKVDSLQIIVVAKNIIVLQLFISRMPKIVVSLSFLRFFLFNFCFYFFHVYVFKFCIFSFNVKLATTDSTTIINV